MTDQSEFKPTNGADQFAGFLMIVVVLVGLVVVGANLMGEEKPKEFNSESAISACKKHYNNGVFVFARKGRVAIEVPATARYGEGWEVSINTTAHVWLKCHVSKSGRLTPL